MIGRFGDRTIHTLYSWLMMKMAGDYDDLNPCDEMYGSPTQGTIRFPTWDSVLPQSIPALGLLSVVESSFLVLLVQKQILVHWIYSHKRSDQPFHKSNTSHPLRASVCVWDSVCAHYHFHSG